MSSLSFSSVTGSLGCLSLYVFIILSTSFSNASVCLLILFLYAFLSAFWAVTKSFFFLFLKLNILTVMHLAFSVSVFKPFWYRHDYIFFRICSSSYQINTSGIAMANPAIIISIILRLLKYLPMLQ